MRWKPEIFPCYYVRARCLEAGYNVWTAASYLSYFPPAMPSLPVPSPGAQHRLYALARFCPRARSMIGYLPHFSSRCSDPPLPGLPLAVLAFLRARISETQYVINTG